MNILLVTPFFHPHKGGSQQYAEELYVNLMKKDPTVEVDVICYNTDNAPEQEKYRGLNVYRVPCLSILPGQFAIPDYIKLWKLLTKLHKKRKYRFINSHTRFFENSWWTPLAAKVLGTKSVLTDHCAFHPNHSSAIVKGISKFVDKNIVPFFCNFYDVVTVTNKATYTFVKNLGIKTPHIVYGGVDTKLFSPLKTAEKVRTIKGIDKEFSKSDIIITFVGRMIYSKGPQLLFEAAKKVSKKHKNVYFVYVGGGKMHDELSKKKLKNTFFLGSLNKDVIVTILQKTDILVHPSMHHEGFPNVLLEAGAAGCTVVATPMGGTSEIVIDGNTGLLVEPAVEYIEAALVSLIQSPSKRKTLRENMRKHIVKNFDWKVIAKEYAELIERVVG